MKARVATFGFVGKVDIQWEDIKNAKNVKEEFSQRIFEIYAW